MVYFNLRPPKGAIRNYNAGLFGLHFRGLLRHFLGDIFDLPPKDALSALRKIGPALRIGYPEIKRKNRNVGSEFSAPTPHPVGKEFETCTRNAGEPVSMGSLDVRVELAKSVVGGFRCW